MEQNTSQYFNAHHFLFSRTRHSRIHVEIRRAHVFEDGYAYLNGLKEQLRGHVVISFTDQYGIPEAGIDGGGLLKECLTL
jgi:hypothetical protein